MRTTTKTALNILNNKSEHIGQIIGMHTKQGLQWVLLKNIESVGQGYVEITYKMITHNHHIGTVKEKVPERLRINCQSLESFKRFCQMYDIEMNLGE